MLVASVLSLYESVLNAGRRNFTGIVQDPKELVKPENWATMDTAIRGVYCFLAFHPRFDSAVFEYVCSPSFPSDTGSNVFAFFTIDASAITPRTLNKTLWPNWLSVEESNYPAYEVVQLLFPSDRPPVLPGVLIAHRLGEPCEPIFVPVDRNMKGDSLSSFMRSLFLYVDESYRRSLSERVPVASVLGPLLARNDVAYSRLSPLTFGEWFFKSLHFIKRKGGDIATIVKLATPLVAGKS